MLEALENSEQRGEQTGRHTPAQIARNRAGIASARAALTMARATARQRHDANYRGWRPLRITVACSCGWISEHHRSRGEAKRSYDGHVWLSRARERSA